MPPRRLITTMTFPPVVAANDVCRRASPNIVIATAPALVAAIPFRKPQRLSEPARQRRGRRTLRDGRGRELPLEPRGATTELGQLAERAA